MVKCDTEDMQTMPHRNYKFCENHCSKIRTLPKGVNEILTYFLHLVRFLKHRHMIYPKNLFE
jgi:hypothetical protein